jgi:hypothetical protein
VLRWIIGAAGLVGVGFVIWLLLSYVAPYVQDEIGGPLSEEVPSSEEDPKPAPGYALVEDDSGNLSVEVPSGWDEPLTGEASEEGESWSSFLGESVGDSITASADLDASYTPGRQRRGYTLWRRGRWRRSTRTANSSFQTSMMAFATNVNA